MMATIGTAGHIPGYDIFITGDTLAWASMFVRGPEAER